MNNHAASIGIQGQFAFDTQESGPSEFLNLVIVSFSVFDRFDPIPNGRARTETTLPYYYVGIKSDGAPAPGDGRVRIKSTDELDAEFGQSLHNVSAEPQHLERWLDAMRIVSSDPGIGDIGVEAMFLSGQADAIDRMLVAFSRMSSGHKIVLLTLTRLVECISDRSLVLMDEPETHLHPPLLGSFVRAVSDLLVSRNAVAIVATHSPVVLQEVPASCVSMLMRSGESLRVLRPDDETFAENVSVLTRKVFGLEIEQSGFYKLLQEAALGRNYDYVQARFDKQIGSEGRALTRAFVAGEE
ncbi:AAA family ATPase [Mesorhizobium sp. M1348]|uniref:AAA family ATPase n=1 Tax=Mesorhizobium sp. M1348 TaxID=2957089 RepID=UPI00333855BB